MPIIRGSGGNHVWLILAQKMANYCAWTNMVWLACEW